jgi:cobaltochelatase CobT
VLPSWLKLPDFFKPKHKRPSFHAYKPYTDKFDRCVNVAELEPLLDRMSPLDGEKSERLWNEFRAEYAEHARKFRNSLAQIENETLQSVDDWDPSQIAITILVDHSGSIVKDRVVLIAAGACRFLVEGFGSLGISAEVLGFTTVGWHGGLSRKMWQENTMPKNPGRLCDLLHIVWKTPNQPIGSFCDETLNFFFNNELGRENIDGEAIQWAAGRLKQRDAKKRILFVISDAAPVDDSTLLANGEDYIGKHLYSTLRGLDEEGEVETMGLGVMHDVSRYYSVSHTAKSFVEAREVSLDYIAHVFTPKNANV